MFVKRISLAIIGAGFLTAMQATPAAAADLSVSGFVGMHLQQFTSTSTDSSSYIKIASSGSDDTYSHMYTAFDEAELKFKAKGKTANGWKTGGEIELEIGQNDKNDFELEEASAYVDFGSVKLTGGILEDWGLETGTVCAGDDKWWDTKLEGSDESAALRLAIQGIENLKLDFKLRYGAADVEDDSTGSTIEIPVTQNETRVQAKYDFGMGYVRLVFAAMESKPVDSDSAGDYAYKDAAQEVLVGLKFGQIAPWFSMINRKETSTEAASGSAEDENKDSQMMLGADFAMSKEMTLTGIYLSAERDFGGDDKAKLTAINLGVAYAAMPVTFSAVYFTSQNNMNTLDSTKEDAKISGFDLGMEMKF